MARAPTVYLDIDISDVKGEIDRLESIMKPEQFDRAMFGVFKETTRHIRTTLRKDLPKQYRVQKKDITSAVTMGRVTHTPGLGVGCAVPIIDARGKVGGRYKAFGGAKGWESLHKKYRVKAHIVKSGTTVLPKRMPGVYGGNPPFRNLTAPKLNGLAFTRKTKKRFPLMPVAGLSIAQMPVNRSEPDVQQDIRDFLQRRIERRLMHLIRTGQ